MESVTITRPGAPTGGDDAQGNPILGAPVVTVSDGWFVAGNNGGGEDQTVAGDLDVMRINIYNRAVVDVRGYDAITLRGNVWKVVGFVEPWVSPWGSGLGGTAVALERAA